MKDKLSNQEILQRSKTFFTTVLEGNLAHTENIKNNVVQLKSTLELELMHYQLLGKVSEVLEALMDLCDNLSEKEQSLTIH